MDPATKQRFQAQAEEGRQKYDVDMAAYRQGSFMPNDEVIGKKNQNSPNHPSPAPSPSYSVQDSRPQQQSLTNTLRNDYSSLLQ